MKKISETILYQAKWLSLVEGVYHNKHGEEIKWESIKRSQETTGMVVIAKMVPSNRFILIKQYRPTLEGYVLGFPAGLADGDVNHALVELREETGYVGKIVEVSPVLKSNAGILNDSGIAVFVQVDENDPANQSPEQTLEPSEDIDVFCIAKEDMKEFLLDQYSQGVHIGGNLWYLFVLSQKI